LQIKYLAAVLWCAAGGSLFRPRATIMTGPRERQQADSQAPGDKPSARDTAQSPAAPATAAPAKAADKPKKVITNDDIKSSPFARFGGLFYTSTGSINDCDANCFDQVRQIASAETNPNWRREVLEQIEFVRSDSEWQAYLHDLYDAHNKVCQLQFDKADELKRSGNMRNLGPQEIAIAEKYDTKMGAAQENLSDAVARQPALQERFVDKPYASSFARMQGMRMQGGFCANWRVIYAQ
jgi:hypothetical protein